MENKWLRKPRSMGSLLPPNYVSDEGKFDLGLPHIRPAWLLNESIKSLDSKFPMVPAPAGAIVLCTTPLGEKLRQHPKYREFDLTDPLRPSLCYNHLHDEHLKDYFRSNDIRKRLIDEGFITNDGYVKCSLKEFNEYRQWIRKLKLDELHRERAQDARQLEETKKERLERMALERDPELLELMRKRRERRKEEALMRQKRIKKEQKRQRKLDEIDCKRREQILELRRKTRDRLQIKRDLERERLRKTKCEKERTDHKIKLRIVTKLDKDNNERLKNLKQRKREAQELKSRKLEEQWFRRQSWSIEYHEQRDKERKEHEIEFHKHVEERSVRIARQRRWSLASYNEIAQANRQAFESEIEKADVFLAKLHDKRERELRDWKKKFDGMHSSSLSATKPPSRSSFIKNLKKRTRRSSAWDLESCLLKDLGLEDDEIGESAYSKLGVISRTQSSLKELDFLGTKGTLGSLRQVEEEPEFKREHRFSIPIIVESFCSIKEISDSDSDTSEKTVSSVSESDVHNAKSSVTPTKSKSPNENIPDTELRRQVSKYVEEIIYHSSQALGIKIRLPERRHEKEKSVISGVKEITNTTEQMKAKNVNLRTQVKEYLSNILDKAEEILGVTIRRTPEYEKIKGKQKDTKSEVIESLPLSYQNRRTMARKFICDIVQSAADQEGITVKFPAEYESFVKQPVARDEKALGKLKRDLSTINARKHTEVLRAISFGEISFGSEHDAKESDSRSTTPKNNPKGELSYRQLRAERLRHENLVMIATRVVIQALSDAVLITRAQRRCSDFFMTEMPQLVLHRQKREPKVEVTAQLKILKSKQPNAGPRSSTEEHVPREIDFLAKVSKPSSHRTSANRRAKGTGIKEKSGQDSVDDEGENVRCKDKGENDSVKTPGETSGDREPTNEERKVQEFGEDRQDKDNEHSKNQAMKKSDKNATTGQNKVKQTAGKTVDGKPRDDDKEPGQKRTRDEAPAVFGEKVQDGVKDEVDRESRRRVLDSVKKDSGKNIPTNISEEPGENIATEVNNQEIDEVKKESGTKLTDTVCVEPSENCTAKSSEQLGNKQDETVALESTASELQSSSLPHITPESSMFGLDSSVRSGAMTPSREIMSGPERHIAGSPSSAIFRMISMRERLECCELSPQSSYVVLPKLSPSESSFIASKMGHLLNDGVCSKERFPMLSPVPSSEADSPTAADRQAHSVKLPWVSSIQTCPQRSPTPPRCPSQSSQVSLPQIEDSNTSLVVGNEMPLNTKNHGHETSAKTEMVSITPLKSLEAISVKNKKETLASVSGYKQKSQNSNQKVAGSNQISKKTVGKSEISNEESKTLSQKPRKANLQSANQETKSEAQKSEAQKAERERSEAQKAGTQKAERERSGAQKTERGGSEAQKSMGPKSNAQKAKGPNFEAETSKSSKSETQQSDAQKFKARESEGLKPVAKKSRTQKSSNAKPETKQSKTKKSEPDKSQTQISESQKLKNDESGSHISRVQKAGAQGKRSDSQGQKGMLISRATSELPGKTEKKDSDISKRKKSMSHSTTAVVSTRRASHVENKDDNKPRPAKSQQLPTTRHSSHGNAKRFSISMSTGDVAARSRRSSHRGVKEHKRRTSKSKADKHKITDSEKKEGISSKPVQPPAAKEGETSSKRNTIEPVSKLTEAVKDVENLSTHETQTVNDVEGSSMPSGAQRAKDVESSVRPKGKAAKNVENLENAAAMKDVNVTVNASSSSTKEQVKSKKISDENSLTKVSMTTKGARLIDTTNSSLNVHVKKEENQKKAFSKTNEKDLEKETRKITNFTLRLSQESLVEADSVNRNADVTMVFDRLVNEDDDGLKISEFQRCTGEGELTKDLREGTQEEGKPDSVRKKIKNGKGKHVTKSVTALKSKTDVKISETSKNDVVEEVNTGKTNTKSKTMASIPETKLKKEFQIIDTNIKEDIGKDGTKLNQVSEVSKQDDPKVSEKVKQIPKRTSGSRIRLSHSKQTSRGSLVNVAKKISEKDVKRRRSSSLAQTSKGKTTKSKTTVAETVESTGTPHPADQPVQKKKDKALNSSSVFAVVTDKDPLSEGSQKKRTKDVPETTAKDARKTLVKELHGTLGSDTNETRVEETRATLKKDSRETQNVDAREKQKEDARETAKEDRLEAVLEDVHETRVKDACETPEQGTREFPQEGPPSSGTPEKTESDTEVVVQVHVPDSHSPPDVCDPDQTFHEQGSKDTVAIAETASEKTFNSETKTEEIKEITTMISPNDHEKERRLLLFEEKEKETNIKKTSSRKAIGDNPREKNLVNIIPRNSLDILKVTKISPKQPSGTTHDRSQFDGGSKSYHAPSPGPGSRFPVVQKSQASRIFRRKSVEGKSAKMSNFELSAEGFGLNLKSSSQGNKPPSSLLRLSRLSTNLEKVDEGSSVETSPTAEPTKEPAHALSPQGESMGKLMSALSISPVAVFSKSGNSISSSDKDNSENLEGNYVSPDQNTGNANESLGDATKVSRNEKGEFGESPTKPLSTYKKPSTLCITSSSFSDVVQGTPLLNKNFSKTESCHNASSRPSTSSLGLNSHPSFVPSPPVTSKASVVSPKVSRMKRNLSNASSGKSRSSHSSNEMSPTASLEIMKLSSQTSHGWVSSPTSSVKFLPPIDARASKASYHSDESRKQRPRTTESAISRSASLGSRSSSQSKKAAVVEIRRSSSGGLCVDGKTSDLIDVKSSNSGSSTKRAVIGF